METQFRVQGCSFFLRVQGFPGFRVFRVKGLRFKAYTALRDILSKGNVALRATMHDYPLGSTVQA